MPKRIITNSLPWEKRVALMDNSYLKEFFIERVKEKNIVGNIYKGRVSKVLPGMQVAFVDIGLEKAGFLHVDDIDLALLKSKDSDFKTPLELPARLVEDEQSTNGNQTPEEKPRIEEILKKGDDILVRVVREPIGTKGARISAHVSLAGRFLVYMPGKGQVNLSRRIENAEERDRLTKILHDLKEEETDGYIIRTVSEGYDEKELKRDIQLLLKIWEDIKERYLKAPMPHLIYEELGVLQRTVRDYFTADISMMVFDSKDDYDYVQNFVRTYLPEYKNKLELYQGEKNIFDDYGIDMEVEKVLFPTVWLKSGGSIVIEKTEALTSIDVNTGRFVGKKNLEETIVQTNLEAIKEIVYQVVLRNLGGIIIIDFIDMEVEENKQSVFRVFEQEIKKDRAKCEIAFFTDLGLVEMCRKRVRDSLQSSLCEPCPYCEGKGFIKSADTICFEIFREIQRLCVFTPKEKKNVLIKVNNTIANRLTEDESTYLDYLEVTLKRKILIETDSSLHMENYGVTIS